MSPWLIGAICLVVGTFIGANLGALLMGVLAAGALADERRRRPEAREISHERRNIRTGGNYRYRTEKRRSRHRMLERCDWIQGVRVDGRPLYGALGREPAGGHVPCVLH